MDLTWAGGRLTSATLRSTLGGVLRLRTPMDVVVRGVAARDAQGPNPNPFFKVAPAGQPQIADEAALPSLRLPATRTIDFDTVEGGVYEILPTR